MFESLSTLNVQYKGVSFMFPVKMGNTQIASSNQRVSYLLFTLIYSSGSFQRSTMQIAISVKKDCLEPEIYQAWQHDITFFLSMKSGKFC